MRPKPIVSADDFGLTKHNTDTILETVRNGAVTSVSVIPNGEALEYALSSAHKEEVRICAHLNLTEGASILPASEVPLLVDKRGHFRHGVISLFFVSSEARKQAKRELEAQWKLVGAKAADGHQHVHMVPWVFDIVTELPGIEHVRIPDEPWYVVLSRPVASCGPRALARLVVTMLCHKNKKVAAQKGIATNEKFLGFLFSGKVTLASVQEGLARAQEVTTGTLELLLHPGKIKENELLSWEDGRANRTWHRSDWRDKERALATSVQLKQLLAAYQHEKLHSRTHVLLRIGRFVFAGGLSALLNLMLLYALTEWAGLWYVTASTIALGAAMVLSFILQKFWAFADRAQGPSVHAQLLSYLLLDGANLLINAILLWFFVDVLGLWYLLGGFLSLGILALESYYILNFHIFRPAASESWLSFWNGNHSIYVSKRHLELHTAKIAADILTLPSVGRGTKFLDYGSGDALSATTLRDAGVEVFLYDPAPAVTLRNQDRFSKEKGIVVLGEESLDLKRQTFDVVLINSVLQYVSKKELPGLLSRLRPLMAEGGALFIADVVPKHASTVEDVRSLLIFAYKGGFLLSALLGLARTAFSSYGQLRKKHGFTTWEEAELLEVLQQHGWTGVRLPSNIGPTAHRMLIRATISA